MKDKRSFWLTISLINLSIVAFFGFTLRSKILFPLPFINYRNFLSAHSHFAFGGWVGLSLITLLIYDLLPKVYSDRKIYQWILAGIEVSSLGMAILFPFQGYTILSIIFSSLYIVTSFVFAGAFFRDLRKLVIDKNVKLLSLSATASLVISSIGPAGLLYIIVTREGNSLLYRDSIYTFLHFQYNGFFTLSVFALLFQYFSKKEIQLPINARRFSVAICLSIIPSLFLALLWHNKILFYLFAALGGVLMLLSLFYFLKLLFPFRLQSVFKYRLSKSLFELSILSFVMKMLLQVGTIIPALGNAVYGDRPVIIGFLHLVFLGFVSFFILSSMAASELLTKGNKPYVFPFVIFSTGVFANELLLGIQGLGILFKTNSTIYQWLLWAASILLFTGAVLIVVARWLVIRDKN